MAHQTTATTVGRQTKNMTKKILIIEPYCPTPSDSGGRVRIGNTLKFLSRYFKIKLLSFYQSRSEVAVNMTWLEKLNIQTSFYQTQDRKFFSYLQQSTPYWFAPWHSPKLIDKLKSINYSSYSSVLVELTQLLYVVDHLPKNTKKVFVAHDVSTISFWRRLSDVSLLKRLVHFPRFLEVMFYENHYLKKYDHVVAVSQNDARFLKLFFRLPSVSVIENGIEKIDFIPPSANNGNTNIGYIGSQKHTPNLNTIRFITQKIYPYIRKKGVNINLAGSDNSKSTLSGINYLGFVPTVRDFYKKIDILVAPIFSGSGSRIKILESLSFGRPVITTKVGAEGIDLQTPLLTIIPPQYQFSPRVWARYIIQHPKTFTSEEYTKLATKLNTLHWSRQLEKLIPLLN